MRPRPLVLRLAAAVLVVLGAFAFAPRPAVAHNTFVSSEPASGATVPAAPGRLSLVFAAAVPLPSASAVLVDAGGVRTDLTGIGHGPAGDTELIVPLPALGPGEVTVRWRLVGPDGHPLTDRVTFTVAPPTTTTAATSVVAAAPTAATPTTTTPSATEPAPADDAPASVPGALRWLLRIAAYLSIMALIGIALVDGLVWDGALHHPRLRPALRWAAVGVVTTGILQLLVLASDVAGGMPGPGDTEVAAGTSAGAALVLRLLLAGCAALLLTSSWRAHADVRWSVLSLTGAGLLATWSFAGHAASQRWPHVGVSLDVVHHLAAALWIGGLAVVGLVAATTLSASELVPVYRRLSRWAATAVAVLVATGLAQTVRLVGGVGALVGSGHGRYLVAKVVVLAGMLAVADANRRRVRLRLSRVDAPAASVLVQLRRGLVAELVLGVAIVGITAAMVTSPPGVAS